MAKTSVVVCSAQRTVLIGGFLSVVFLMGQAVASTTVLVSGIPFFQESSSESDRIHLVVNGGRLFWSDSAVARVNMVPVTGGQVTTLAKKMGNPASVVTENKTLFWVEVRDGYGESGCVGPGNQKYLKMKTPDGSETVLATGDNCAGGTNDVVIDSNYVYWVTSVGSPNTYTIQKVPIDGGPATPLVTTSTDIVAVARDASTLYWEEEFFPDPGSIKRMPLGGGAATVLYASDHNPLVGNFVVRGSELFFADMGFPQTPRLLQMPSSGGAVTVIRALGGRPNPQQIVVDDNNIYWTDPYSVMKLGRPSGEIATLADDLYSPVGLAADSENVYWSDSSSPCCSSQTRGSIKKVPIAGGPITILADQLRGPGVLAVDASSIYWTEASAFEGHGRIASIPIAGGAVSTVAEGITSNLAPIAVDGTNVYIADRWTVKKVPISGGVVEDLAVGDFYIAAIATDGSFVYWTEDPSCTVRKVSVTGGPITTLADGSGPAGPILADGVNVFWMDQFDTINKISVNGGPVVTIASGLPFLSDFTIDAANVYFSTVDSGLLAKISMTDGIITALANGEYASFNVLAIDDQNLYWIDQFEVGQVPKVGGGTTIITQHLLSESYIENGIVADGTAVYWAEAAGGTIKSATPSIFPVHAQLSFVPKSVSFPSQVALGEHRSTSKAKKIRITNLKNRRQNEAVAIKDISTDDPEFNAAQDCIGVLAPGTSCDVAVTFTPRQVGKCAGNLIVNSSATNSTLRVPLRGRGRLGKIAIKPLTLKFGRVPVGTPLQKPVVLANHNPVPMDIRGIITSDAQFVVSGCTDTEIQPMSSCTVEVTFTPAASGKQQTTMSIDDDATGNPHSVKIVGTGQ